MTAATPASALDRLAAFVDRLDPGLADEATDILQALREEAAASLAQQRSLAESQADALVNAAMMMSELEQTHAELDRARQAAEAASVAKSRFLATMSHEIRTPMNGIMGMLQIVLSKQLEPQQQGRLETAYRSAEALLALLNDILEFSKLEAGRYELECRPFSVADLVVDVGNLFGQSCAARGLALHTEFAPGLAGLHVGDPHRLRQILNNLVGNAVKFTTAGEVRVRVDAAAIIEGRQQLVVSVSDTGIGIPADRLDQLFQPFSQVDSSTARRFGGSGLGLAICRQLSELMGGRIEARSIENAGSTFSLHLALPAAAAGTAGAEPHRNEQAAMTAPTDQLGPARVLLVEDNAVNRELATAMLEAAGLEVTIAEDGDAALGLGAGHSFDLVLMDCEMPGRDGYSTTREWRRRERVLDLPHTPVIALTANAMPGDREACLAAGMDDYLAKPFSRDALLAMLRRWLDAETAAAVLRTG